MMRRQSATFYMKNILETTTELLDKMDYFMNENGEVDDLLELCLLWALESIAGSFLDTHLGCFENHLSPASDANKFVKALKVGLGDDLTELALGPPLWKLWSCGQQSLTEDSTRQLRLSVSSLIKWLKERNMIQAEVLMRKIAAFYRN